MPTYTVTTSNVNLNSKKQKELAKGITKVHNVVTGANTYFAQVIFNNTKKKNHFMGGKIVKEPSIFLLGQIRAGRPKKTKDRLISDLKNIIVKTSKLDETQEIAKKYDAVCTPDFFGYNKDLKLNYRGRIRELRDLKPIRNGTSELFEAMKLISETQKGPDIQKPSLGCSIKWFKK